MPATKPRKTTPKAKPDAQLEPKATPKDKPVAKPETAPAPTAPRAITRTEELPASRLPPECAAALQTVIRRRSVHLEAKQNAKDAKDAFESAQEYYISICEEHLPGHTRPGLFEQLGSSEQTPTITPSAPPPAPEPEPEPEKPAPDPDGWKALPVSTLESCGLPKSTTKKLADDHAVTTLEQLSAAMPKLKSFKGFGPAKVSAIVAAWEQFWVRNKQYTQAPAPTEKGDDGWTDDQETPEGEPDVQILTRDQVDAVREAHEGWKTHEIGGPSRDLNRVMQRVRNHHGDKLHDPSAESPAGGFVLEIEDGQYVLSSFTPETD